MKFWKLASAVTALILSTNVNAALVAADRFVSGDGLITQDTETGLEWLDLTETVGMSYNSVTSELGDGGLFEGWRYATAVETFSLFDSAGGNGSYYGWSEANNGIVVPLLDLWSRTASGGGGHPFSYFLTAESHSEGRHEYGYVSDYNHQNDVELTHDHLAINSSVDDFDSFSARGSALVRASVVPVPAAVWLFGSGLIGLAGLARRKQS